MLQLEHNLTDVRFLVLADSKIYGLKIVIFLRLLKCCWLLFCNQLYSIFKLDVWGYIMFFLHLF